MRWYSFDAASDLSGGKEGLGIRILGQACTLYAAKSKRTLGSRDRAVSAHLSTGSRFYANATIGLASAVCNQG